MVEILNSQVVRIGFAHDVTVRGAPAAFAETQKTLRFPSVECLDIIPSVSHTDIDTKSC